MPDRAPLLIPVAADVSLLLIYGGVCAFFVYRFARWRKAPSLWLAFLPSGWVLVALMDLGFLGPSAWWLRWVGVSLGAALLWAVFRADRFDAEEPGR